MTATAIRQLADVLSRRTACLHLDEDGSMNRFQAALGALDRLARQTGIPLAIVGGMAAIHYGNATTTEDLDLVVATQDLARLLDEAPRFGFKVAWRAPSGWHTLMHGDVEVNIVPEGGKAKNDSPTTIPGPAALGVATGLDYAALPGWVELKLSSYRAKDRAHVVEVLKRLDEPAVAAIRDRLAAVHPLYLERLAQALADAESERQAEEERGKPRR